MTVQSSMDSAGKLLPTDEGRSYWPLYTVRVSKPRKCHVIKEQFTLKSIDVVYLKMHLSS